VRFNPNIAKFYHKKVERLSEALHHPSERDEAACAIRGLIERVTLFPGAKPGEMSATLHGEFGAMMEWASQHDTAGNNGGSGSVATPMSVSVVAGARNHHKLLSGSCDNPSTVCGALRRYITGRPEQATLLRVRA